MPYKVNPVSPKSIYSIMKSFCSFISYYLNNGLTEMSSIALKIVFVYFVSAFLGIITYIIRKIPVPKKH